tara:strand:- start:298 stop:702 length:405 start_codon:yes stop_codon:yes gene_type:complete
MALPTSGALTLDQIIEEVFGSSGATSTLGTCGSVAGFSNPVSFSDFYGYSSVSGAVNLGYALFNAALSCSVGSGSYATYYHNGAGTLPVIFNKLYTDAAKTSPAINGYYSNGSDSYRVFGSGGSAGSIISVTSC